LIMVQEETMSCILISKIGDQYRVQFYPLFI